MIHLAIVALMAVASPAAAPPQSHYHMVEPITIGGEGGWDYLTMDSASRRLFVSHADRVNVVNVDTRKVVGEIPKTEGVHGIALAHGVNRGFVSNGRTSTVTIFELDSLKVIGETKVDERPDAILFEPVSGRVFTFNAGGKNTTAIDAASGTVAGSLPLGGKPEFSVADGKGRVYVNIEDTNEIIGFDAKTLAVVKKWKLAGCDGPSGLAMDQKNRRLFSVCGNKTLAVSDPDGGTVVATVPIGSGVDGVAFDSAEGLIFSSNGADGTMTVVREVSKNEYKVEDTVKTQKGARTITLDEKTHHIFLPTSDFGEPPAPTAERPRPRPPVVPGSFRVIEVAP